MNLNRVGEGLTLVTVGAILLGNTTGYLPWGVWLTIFSLWPLLVIAVGVEVLGKSVGSEWLRLLSSIIVIGGLVAGALVLPSNGLRWLPSIYAGSGETTRYTFDAEHESMIETGRAFIVSGAGEIAVSDGDDLATAEIHTALDNPSFETMLDGDHAQVDIHGGRGTSRGTGEMDVTLDQDVSWGIDVEAGAIQLEADLSDLWVTSLAIDVGASDLDITLGDRADHLFVTVRAGVSHVVIRVPEGLPTQVTSRVGLGGHDLDEAFERDTDADGRVWRTDGFDESGPFAKIDLEVGISNVEIVTY